MVDQQLIHTIVREEDTLVPTLFKPGQFKILQKLDQGKSLTENEQRYLRGNMKRKLQALQKIMNIENKDELHELLGPLGSYYITGLAALKHNGYGWFYEPKVIEVINTKIEGKVALPGKTLKFIRVKSISKSKIMVDKETHLKYAQNEQILKDIALTKNRYTKTIWMQMYRRYTKMFAKGRYTIPETKNDFAKYGV
jgi:hypothetical protein